MSYDAYTFASQTSRLRPLREPPPTHRHGAPSGPWPFLDLDDKVDSIQLNTSKRPRRQDEETESKKWPDYPQSLFPNWSPFQQKKSGISKVINRRVPANKDSVGCVVYKADIWEDGTFHGTKDDYWIVKDSIRHLKEADATKKAFWDALHEKPPSQARIQALFVQDLSGAVLQMLGTKFNIEPFFFSSSLNWIPSRFQEQVEPGLGDHITIILPFIRTLPNPSLAKPASSPTNTSDDDEEPENPLLSPEDQTIDTQGPLLLHSSSSFILFPDLLSLHVIRNTVPPSASRQNSSATTSTTAENTTRPLNMVISYHAPSSPSYQRTSASTMHTKALAAGRSVYWSHIFKDTVPSGDPTFVALCLLWYPMYAWDEALEILEGEVGWLESQTLSTLPTANNPFLDAHSLTQSLTHQLHVVRAHLLHYESLLQDFKKSVVFLQITKHPGLPRKDDDNSKTLTQSPRTASTMPMFSAARPRLQITTPMERYPFDDSDSEASAPEDSGEAAKVEDRQHWEALLKKETTNLLDEINRLEMTRKMLDNRLGNVMRLAFSSVNIDDSRRMRQMTEAAVKDSAVMKQIAYLTMFFLPASFVANIFGMNIPIINPGTLGSLGHYFAVAIPLTITTVSVMMFQYHRSKRARNDRARPSDMQYSAGSTSWKKGESLLRKVMWPVKTLAKELVPKKWWWRRVGTRDRQHVRSGRSSRATSRSRDGDSRQSSKTREHEDRSVKVTEQMTERVA